MGDLSSIDEAIRTNIRKERELHGWTQTDLSSKLLDISDGFVNLHYTAIARLETGGRGISLLEGIYLARLFGITVSQLIGEVPINRQQHEVEVAVRKAADILKEAHNILTESVQCDNLTASSATEN